MHIHQDWATDGFELPVVAPATSVFPHRDYLERWWHHFGTGEVSLVEDESALLALRQLPDGSIAFVGDEDLTDYHAPLGVGSGALLGAFLDRLPSGTRYRFDSLPAEAADELASGLGSRATGTQHESAFRVALPGDFESFLAGLSKKERHELRRKHRRFGEAVGAPRLLEGTVDPVGTFAQLHRLAEGRKGRFMTTEREGFFRDLATLSGARVDILAGDEGFPVAAAIGFQDADAYYLYNSAYDPARAAASPGIVMLWMLFQSVIADGVAIFDFLKGDEAYKLRLGAEPRPLYVLEGRT
ncbi:MAG: GNAT family N-acetyltransferase [Acidimicrobiia bacterium]|nr:GNAT family N-acetyltransferase [Acidimicrobiia bacterium]